MATAPDEFLERFVLPLCAGGELHVGAPLDLDDLDDLRAYTQTASQVGLDIELARQDEAALLWLYEVPTAVDDETLRLAVGLHNVLFVSHPSAEGWTVRDRRVQEVLGFARRCIDLGPPKGSDALVARHTLLSGLLSLTRTDTELRFWVGRRNYVGQRPPTRLLAWRGVRRVRENRNVVHMLSTELHFEQRALIELLLAQSPLTELLSPLRQWPPFDSSLAYPVLHDKLVSRAVAHRYLQIGLDRLGPVLAADFWRQVREPLVPREMPAARRRHLLSMLACWGNAERARRVASNEADEIAALQALAAPRLPLQMMAQLVQYLYITGCYFDIDDPLARRDRAVADLAAGERRSAESTAAQGTATPSLAVADAPDQSLISVLVAASDCGLGPDERSLGPRVAERYRDLVTAARRALGPAAADLSRELAGALGVVSRAA